MISKTNKNFQLPTNFNPLKVKIVMVGEAVSENEEDYFYSTKNSLYITNTIEAFNKADIKVKTIDDILKIGVYLTVTVKEPRKGPTVPTEKIKEYSYVLEEELHLFPNLKVILLMGDVAIKALNYISMRKTNVKVIPSGSTYKIRKRAYYFNNIRVFPSYLQTGKNFLIEKSKREMVAEDIQNAFKELKE